MENGPQQERRLEVHTVPVPEIKPGEVLIQVAGCGVCGTDLSIYYDNVPTISRPPLALGHEVSGTVIDGEKEWIGKNVVVPTIFPCNKCELCASGRANRCLRQKMLGYSFGSQGGFSTHIVVSSRDLCEIPQDAALALEKLAVVADAVATPFQAARRSNLQKGDKVVVIGVTGGLGIFMAQWAKVLGAAIIVGIGRNDEKLEAVKKYGVDHTINVSNKSVISAVSDFWSVCKKRGHDPKCSWKIYEMSGTAEGQQLGLELLKYAGSMTIVGYGLNESRFNFSKLMAFDSEIIGTWGCAPAQYPFILKHVLNGNIDVGSLVEVRSMSALRETFRELREGRTSMKRIVLTPDQKFSS